MKDFRPFNGKSGHYYINRLHKEIGVCSIGAQVNITMYRVVKEQIGDHYNLVLCPNHKIQLAIHGAFHLSNLNPLSETNLANVYHLFHWANLWWRLFKWQAVFQVNFIIIFFPKNQIQIIFMLSFVLVEPCFFSIAVSSLF